MKSYLFPSVLEKHGEELKNVFDELIKGMKIYHDDEAYLVGDIALVEGTSPHRVVNSSPLESDYRILSKAAVLLASSQINKPLNITVGFPYSTYNANRGLAVDFFKGRHDIYYDLFAFEKNFTKKVEVEIESVDVIPEILGCSFAVRNHFNSPDNCFVVNLGYGTFEACLTNNYGLVDRTVISTNGIKYAVEDCMKELNKKYYLGLRTSHKFDTYFQRGSIMVNRRHLDFSEIKMDSLKKYYNEVISPAIRNTWTDDDFDRTRKLYLAGGGSNFQEIVKFFQEEFNGILDVEVIPEPHLSVSKGYYLRSLKLTNDKETAVGIDIGNAQTVVTYGLPHYMQM